MLLSGTSYALLWIKECLSFSEDKNCSGIPEQPLFIPVIQMRLITEVVTHSWELGCDRLISQRSERGGRGREHGVF